MATTPPTFVAATELAAADLNLIRDAILELQLRADGADYMGVQVQRNTNQAVADSTDVAVSFGTQVADIGGWWSSGTNIVVPAGAIPAGAGSIAVRVVMRATFASDSSHSRRVLGYLNGVAFGSKVLRGSDDGPTDVELIEVAYGCVAGDVITMIVRQSTGSSLNITFAQATVERAGVDS